MSAGWKGWELLTRDGWQECFHPEQATWRAAVKLLANPKRPKLPLEYGSF